MRKLSLMNISILIKMKTQLIWRFLWMILIKEVRKYRMTHFLTQYLRRVQLVMLNRRQSKRQELIFKMIQSSVVNILYWNTKVLIYATPVIINKVKELGPVNIPTSLIKLKDFVLHVIRKQKQWKRLGIVNIPTDHIILKDFVTHVRSK